MSEKLFVSFRNHTLIQPGTGVTAMFEANVPRGLRESLHLQARAEGIVPYTKAMEAAVQANISEGLDDPIDDDEDEIQAVAPEDQADPADPEPVVEPTPAAVPPVPAGERMSVEEGIRILLREGTPEDFGVRDRLPKIRSLEKIIGYNIDGAQRDAAWDNVNAEMTGSN